MGTCPRFNSIQSQVQHPCLSPFRPPFRQDGSDGRLQSQHPGRGGWVSQNSRPAWSIELLLGQIRLHKETLSGGAGVGRRQNGDKVNKATRPRKNAYQVKALTLAGRFSYLLWYFQSYASRVASLTNRCSHGPCRILGAPGLPDECESSLCAVFSTNLVSESPGDPPRTGKCEPPEQRGQWWLVASLLLLSSQRS